MNSIRKATAFIDEHRCLVNPEFRPTYHAAAPCGWINDPNGFCYMAENDGEFFAIEYDVERQVLRIDRSRAGYLFGKDGSPEEKPYREAMLYSPFGRLGLRVYMDRSSCELFSKDGRLVMSSLICPKKSADSFSCSSDDGSAGFVITAWKLYHP